MAEREKLFSVTLQDCEVQHFRAGGPGGQNQNKRDSATRVIHHPSGARGESREHRTQPQNTRAAFERMAATPSFRFWVSEQVKTLAGEQTVAAKVQAMLDDPAQTIVEVRDGEDWVRVPAGELLAAGGGGR